MKTELKPCPFCGGEANLDREDIFCSECDANIPIDGYIQHQPKELSYKEKYENARKEMIEAWNGRSNDSDVHHGHWIPKKEMIRSPEAKNYNCSACGKESFAYPNCPYCRAIMDGKENEK